MLYDIFIHPSATTTPTPETEPSYLIDHDSTLTTPLQTYLKRHILRSKVKLAKAAESDKVVITAWLRDGAGDGGLIERGREWLRAVARAGEDYRAPGLGWRWVALKEDAADRSSFPTSHRCHERLTPPRPPSVPAELFTPVTPSHHHLHRLTLAIPEGPTDWPQLPLEGNLELMGGVDYRKGCYVGQELTARTFFKGVVRKRGVGVRLFREGEELRFFLFFLPLFLLCCFNKKEGLFLLTPPPIPPHSIPTTLLPPNPPYTPFPTLFPLPTSQSSLTPLTSTSTRPRPSGKIGSSLPLVSRSGSSTALAFASVRLEHIDESGGGGVLVVNPLLVEGEEGENGFESGEEGGRWLGKAFVPDWVRERLEEASRAKGE